MYNEHDVHLQYWKKKLEGNSGILPLPADLTAAEALPVTQAGRKPFMIPRAVSTGLKQLASEQDTTLYVVFLAAFKLLLKRYSNVQDIAVGAYLTDLLLLRSDVNEDAPLSEYLIQEEKTLLEASSHHQLPPSSLENIFGAPGQEVFNTLFLMQDKTRMDRDGALSDKIDAYIDQIDIALRIVIDFDGISAEFFYQSRRFSTAFIKRLMSHFLCLLGNFSDDVSQPLKHIPILSAEEEQQIIENNSICRPLENASLSSDIEYRLQSEAETPAFYSGSRQISLKEVADYSQRTAAAINALQLPKDTVVGVLGFCDVEWIVNALAVIRCGYKMLPLAAEKLPAELQKTLNHLSPALLIGDKTVKSTLEVLNSKSNIPYLCSSEAKLTEEPLASGSSRTGGLIIPFHSDTRVSNLLLSEDQLYTGVQNRIQYLKLSAGEICSRQTNSDPLHLLIPALSAILSGSALLIHPHNTRPSVDNEPDIMEFYDSNISLDESLAPRHFSLINGSQSSLENLRMLFSTTTVEMISEMAFIPAGANSISEGISINRLLPQYVLDSHGRSVPPGVSGMLHFGGLTKLSGDNEISGIRRNSYSRNKAAVLLNTNLRATYEEDFNIRLLPES
ncbi:MAG: condensation domain-containing protein [Calditrichota bacterium]